MSEGLKWPFSWIPKTIWRQFLWKTYSKSSLVFQSAHTSEPYLTTVISVASIILILVCRSIFLFFQTFSMVKKKWWKKNPTLGYSTFNMFTAPTIFTNNTTKVSEAYFRTIFDHCHHCSFHYSNLGLQTYLPILPSFFNGEKKPEPWLFYF